jgi:hypothetical protein
MGYNEEKRKSHEDYLELRILYFIWVLEAPYYQGDALGESVKCKSSKTILSPKFPIRLDLSGFLTGFQRARSDMSGPLPYLGITQLIWLLSRVPELFSGHVRPNPSSSVAKSKQPHPAPYSGSRELSQTCLAPSLDMSGLSTLSQVKSLGSDMSGPQAGFQRWLRDMSVTP